MHPPKRGAACAVADAYRRWIGHLPPGTELGTIRDIATQHDLSYQEARRAVMELRGEGLVTYHAHTPVFVAEQAEQKGPAEPPRSFEEAVDELVDTITADIESGALQPQDSLGRQAIRRRYDTGETLAKEALKVLTERGDVEFGRRGRQVAPIARPDSPSRGRG